MSECLVVLQNTTFERSPSDVSTAYRSGSCRPSTVARVEGAQDRDCPALAQAPLVHLSRIGAQHRSCGLHPAGSAAADRHSPLGEPPRPQDARSTYPPLRLSAAEALLVAGPDRRAAAARVSRSAQALPFPTDHLRVGPPAAERRASSVARLFTVWYVPTAAPGKRRPAPERSSHRRSAEDRGFAATLRRLGRRHDRRARPLRRPRLIGGVQIR